MTHLQAKLLAPTLVLLTIGTLLGAATQGAANHGNVTSCGGAVIGATGAYGTLGPGQTRGYAGVESPGSSAQVAITALAGTLKFNAVRSGTGCAEHVCYGTVQTGFTTFCPLPTGTTYFLVGYNSGIQGSAAYHIRLV